MNKVILITGSSSGIGKATAKLFATKGWRVVATMRSPDKDTELKNVPNITVMPLDVTDNLSVQKAVAETIDRYGRIDALVNNAGYALVGPLEAMSEDEIDQQFRTNTLGLINVTKTVLPHLRAVKSGSIVNISSMLGRMALPFFSMYCSSKWAVEGFSEALAYEVKPYNIKVRVIEPGTIKTNFFTSEISVKDKLLGSYKKKFDQSMAIVDTRAKTGASPDEVARVVYRATVSRSAKLRYAVGPNSRLLINLHRFLPASLYQSAIYRKMS